MPPSPRRPFRFGVQVSSAPDGACWAELGRRVEGLGYSTITMPDHFGDQLAPVPALTAVAAATTTLRMGALVYDNDYKHPLVLAKELATMDVLSDGRVEIGLGAGWLESDYRAAGIPYDRPGRRIDRFEEGLAVIKGCLAEGPFSFAGEHYTITDYDGRPQPVQRPCPPLLVGGGGPRVLGIAAREADIVGINGTMTAGVVGPDAIATMTLAAVEEKLAVVRAAAGDRLTDIELNIRVFFAKVTDDRAGTIDSVASMISVDPAMIAASPFALIGDVDQVVDEIERRRDELGFSYLIVGAENIDEFAPVVAQLANT